jgi:hypothetical protein
MINKKIKTNAAEKFKLRVSVGALVKVLFTNPATGQITLALERIATLRKLNGIPRVDVTAKPFGGGVRFTNPEELKRLIKDFRYDSDRSRQERDFRILIHPEMWSKIKEICNEHLHENRKRIFDFSPDRELAEEFEDSLKIKIKPDEYILIPKGMVTQDSQSKTNNIRAQGMPTVRIYYIFEAWIKSNELVKLILTKSRQFREDDFKKDALGDAERGGKGRANSVLTIGIDVLRDFCNSIPLEKRGGNINFGAHKLEENVLALFSEVKSLNYNFEFN